MTTVRPTETPNKVDTATRLLILWLEKRTSEAVRPEANKPEEWLDTLNTCWVIVQNKVGWYREKSYALTDDQKKAWIATEHNMKILVALYGQKG